jgi:alpha-N-arabinofuranosidase
MKRRAFVGSALAGGVVLAAGRFAGASQSRIADARVEVLVGEPVGRIAPEIYGHFAEHLGGVVYDGIWVGENSRIPNTGGIRQALIDAMKRIKPGVIRWPGGCFADSYNWRDGIEARSKRPRRPSFWIDAREWPQGVPDGPWKYDTNQFGTDEFLRFCELSGGKPYLAANLRSLTARDFYEWVDYCNSPAGTTTLADTRATGGRRDAWNVRYWGIGNESWGCGGNFTPEEYAQEFRRYAEWVPRYGVDLAYIGSGPNAGDLSWTRRFFGRLAEKGGFGRLWGWGLHHYSWNVTGGRTTDWWQGKGDAVKYTNDEWYELLSEANKVENLITDHWAVMGEFDRQHRVKLVVDEWGAWYKPGSEVNNTHLLGQQSTMRDAVLAGLSLDIFHNHADKVAMANIAQLINCLQALFLAHEDHFVLTPTYHVFDMYSAHQGADAVRTQISAAKLSYNRNGRPATMRGLGGSASVKGKQLVVTLTNADPISAKETEIGIKGATAKDVRVTMLSSKDIHDHNSFAAPRNIEPRAGSAAVRTDGTVTITIAPASVVKLEVNLA